MAFEQRGLYRPDKNKTQFTSSNIFNTAPPPSPYSSPVAPPATEKKFNLRMIVIIGGIFVIVIIGVVLFIILRQTKPLLAKLPKNLLSNIGAAFGTRLLIPGYKGPLLTIAHPDGSKQADFYATSNSKVLKTSNGTTLEKWLNNISFGSVYKLYDQTGGSPMLVSGVRLAKVFYSDLRMVFEAECILKRDGLYNIELGPVGVACNIKPGLIKSTSLDANTKTFMNKNRIISINATKSNDDFGVNGCGIALAEKDSLSLFSRGSTAPTGIWATLTTGSNILGPKQNTVVANVVDVGQLRMLVNNISVGPTEMQTVPAVKPAASYPAAVPKCSEPAGGDIAITLNRDGTFEGELNDIVIINGNISDTELYLIRDALGAPFEKARP